MNQILLTMTLCSLLVKFGSLLTEPSLTFGLTDLPTDNSIHSRLRRLPRVNFLPESYSPTPIPTIPYCSKRKFLGGFHPRVPDSHFSYHIRHHIRIFPFPASALALCSTPSTLPRCVIIAPKARVSSFSRIASNMSECSRSSRFASARSP
ncbi:MAG: hypothetical protein K0R28_4389 [Paenibacillus sp.]|nr:hypothetical protein [Paenibacillus sp.]